MNKQLIEEVQELTSFIRPSGDWPDIRKLILDGGFNPDTCMLASFMEGEENQEWGVIVTKNKCVFELFRHSDGNVLGIEWREITNIPDTLENYPQVNAAVSLLEGSN